MQNKNLQQFHQYPIQNPQNFPQNSPNPLQNPPNQQANPQNNQPQNPQNQQPNQQNNNFSQNQQQFLNFMSNPNMFMMPPMNPEQQQFMLNMLKREAFQKGQIQKKQKETMEMIHRNRMKREEERKTGELVLFFNYKYDILPITITADKIIPELLNMYIVQSGNQNVKFFFKENELKVDDQSCRQLYEIEGLRTGEEIIVKDINQT